MKLRAAISFFGQEWNRLHLMIEALEREAETHHKRHLEREPRDPARPGQAGVRTGVIHSHPAAQPGRWSF